MIKGIDVENLVLHKVLSKTEKNIITAIYQDDNLDQKYLTDLFFDSTLSKYYTYAISDENLERYEETKNRLFLYPKVDEVYLINFKANEILDIYYDIVDLQLSIFEQDWKED